MRTHPSLPSIRPKRWLFGLAILCVLLVHATLSRAQDAQAAATVPAGSGAGTEVPAESGSYVLGAGDKLRLTVFGEDQISGEYQVDAQGRINVPLAGNVVASGTVAALETRIAESLGRFLVNPQVSVQVLSYRPVFIMGEVNNDGQYPYVPGMTVESAVAIAGGYTYRASKARALLRRGAAGSAESEVTPTHELKPGDIVTIPERFF